MLNQDLNLNPRLFSREVERVSPRDGFGEGVILAGEKDERVVVLTADLARSTKVEEFAQKFPSRFIQVGVAEQNLVTVASGLAAVGKIPFIASYAIFSPGRNWEQIRTTVCYNNQPVKIVGTHAGLNVGPDGATHQSLEDLALMRVLPNMVVLSPSDVLEARKATLSMAFNNQPCYLRLPRFETPVITSEDTPFEIGKGEIFYKGKDVTIISTGSMVYTSLLVAEELKLHNISVRVINLHTIKPLDKKIIIEAAEETGAIVTVEEHQIYGGLGSAVAEILSENFPTPLKRVGIFDQFGQSGKPEDLFKEYGLTVEEVKKAVTSVLSSKS